jgi:hypothetical protein
MVPLRHTQEAGVELHLQTVCLSISRRRVGFRNLIFQTEVVEQRFGAVVLPHHDQQPSDDQNPTEHG